MEKKKNYSIKIENVTKKFKIYSDKPNTLKERIVFFKKNNVEHRTVLEDINLTIKKGETVALIGVNGSGKSTLLKLMTKIIYPTTGKITTVGKLTSLLELGAGFHDDFTGRENIYFNAAIFGLTKEEIDAKVDDIIAFSSGMYMRLAFSVAINVNADILLIDEILAVGDQHFQEKCYQKLNELKESDRTIVIVSHSLDALKKLCTRAIWIHDGHIREDGNVTKVIDHYLKECE